MAGSKPTGRDETVTGRQRAGRTAFLEAIVENIPAMIFVKDADELRFVRFNRAGEDLLGMRREDLYGRNDYDFFPKDEADFFTTRDREVLAGEGVVDIPEEPIHTKHHGVRILHTKKIPVRDTDGKPLYLLGISEDITERKRADEELHRSRQMLEQVLANIPMGVFWKDTGSRYLGCNVMLARLAGLASPRDIIGRTDHEMPWRADAERYRADDREVMESGTPKLDYEEPIPLPDGTVRWARTSKVPLSDRDGHVIGMLGTFEDITERKRAQEELERSNRELEQFAYVASHDLQEPLRMVSSFVQLLARRYGDLLDADGRSYVEFAVEGAQRAQQLIDDLLKFSRVGTRGQDLRPIRADAALDQALANLSLAILESGAAVEREPLPMVLADESQLAQVFQNLVANAVKFRGETPPRIRVTAARGEIGWVFAVADNGIGIEPRFHDRVFAIFQRLHTRKEFPGTGIGLALVRKIVERHGGRAWVESAPGAGATFYFTLRGADGNAA
jgi:PAS domain S-box-containing protein